jgi:asparagine synthase (glutamine-hydrolysing)
MCGIFTLLNNDLFPIDLVKTQFEKGKGRGPESSKLENVFIKTTFGFHRLAINGLNEKSNQPLVQDNISLICNGEIYNYRELYERMGIQGETESDCEVIIHLYKRYGIEQTLTMLDGVFSFVLVDFRNSLIDNNELTNQLFVARDPYGVRPLYQLSISSSDTSSKNNTFFGFASELKSLSGFTENTNHPKTNKVIEPFSPGTYSRWELSNRMMSFWHSKQRNIPYHKPSFSFSYRSMESKKFSSEHLQDYCSSIQKRLINAVYKRCLTTERTIACLLSG